MRIKKTTNELLVRKNRISEVENSLDDTDSRVVAEEKLRGCVDSTFCPIERQIKNKRLKNVDSITVTSGTASRSPTLQSQHKRKEWETEKKI